MIDVEILEDILSRLPAKSIGRFRCVSKPWKSLLSHPRFIKAHLNRTKQLCIEEQSILFISDDSNSLYSVQLKNANLPETAALPTMLNFGNNHRFSSDSVVQHVASCDGLVLVKDDDDKLLLVNPTTREIKELPAAPCALKPDASVTMHMYGLGYDSSTDDHKVLSVSYYNEYFDYYYGHDSSESEDSDSDSDSDSDFTDTSVCVYSVKNGTWKTVDSSPYDHNVAHSSSGVFVNGNIHFIASKTSDHSSVIVAFDLEEEKFLEVPPPSSDECAKFVFGRLAMVEGCLCMVPSWMECQTIFVMKEYNVEESWTKVSAANYENLSIRPLCSLGKDKMVLLISEDSIDERLAICNLEDGRSKDVLVQGLADEFCVKGTYVESLVSPHCIHPSEVVNED